MHVISRRDIVRSSAFLMGSPILLSLSATTIAQSDTSPSTSHGLPVNNDLVKYLVDRHASYVAHQIKNGPSAINHRVISDHWRLLASHLEDIDFDSQLRTVLPSLIQRGAFTQITESSYGPAIDMATSSVARYGASLSRSEILGATGAFPSGDMTNAVQSAVNDGISTYCRKVADVFRYVATNDSVITPSAFSGSSDVARLIRVSCWKGQTKQEQYTSCQIGETAIASIILGVGEAACIAIAACAAALAAESAFSLGVGAFATVGALATWLISYYCNPILS